jgi:hypothetical protein
VGSAINMMLPSTCVFDYPTCASLAGFISGTQVRRQLVSLKLWISPESYGPVFVMQVYAWVSHTTKMRGRSRWLSPSLSEKGVQKGSTPQCTGVNSALDTTVLLTLDIIPSQCSSSCCYNSIGKWLLNFEHYLEVSFIRTPDPLSPMNMPSPGGSPSRTPSIGTGIST